ncbi:hypothetical protein [Nocardia pseudobrasiliensis]|uniref:hypothetical protein n=1 Tax=Nocardia pseudobrasiliensis TaxID=45979 RepID=UPI00082ECDA9|nr:hypothetical protein [Nocardia pseudobrasiliensis]
MEHRRERDLAVHDLQVLIAQRGYRLPDRHIEFGCDVVSDLFERGFRRGSSDFAVDRLCFIFGQPKWASMLLTTARESPMLSMSLTT